MDRIAHVLIRKLNTGLEVGNADVPKAHTKIPENTPDVCYTFVGRVSPQLFNNQPYSWFLNTCLKVSMFVTPWHMCALLPFSIDLG